MWEYEESTSWTRRVLLISLFIVGPAYGQEVDTPEPSETVDESPTRDGFGLSLGTGPLPVNLFTLGLTGLGTRLYLPSSGVRPYVNMAWTRGHEGSWNEGERDGRYVQAGNVLTLSGGARGEFTDDVHLVPYWQAGGALSFAGSRNGRVDADEFTKNSLAILTGSAGVGADGFVVPGHLSVGIEVGGLVGFGFGGGARADGTDLSNKGGLLLSSYGALQATVWQ